MVNTEICVISNLPKLATFILVTLFSCIEHFTSKDMLICFYYPNECVQ